MVLDSKKMKALNRAPEMCWECYNCVKICPQQAIDVRGYADFVPMGVSVVPLRGSEDIMWTVKFRSGQVKRFKFPIRTIAEGQVKPDGGFGEATTDLSSQCLCNEPGALKIRELPTIKKESF
jgi:adenylylsulfate reductase subunit B